MNDEIKEIIEYFKDDIDYLEEELKCPNFKGRYITIRDKECEYLRKLLDYITNLQEENKHLDEVNCHLRKKINNEYEDYKSRNEKAIEYVNTHKPSDTISFPLMKKDEENQVKSCFDYEFREIYQKELLEILKGSDKE